jgi:phage-related protein
MRVLIQTEEFLAYYNDLPDNIKCKFDHAMNVLRDVVVPNSKFVKRLVDTDFYELRVSVATNEYRTIIFAIDNENIVNATQILLLNAFLKKSTKDYKKQIKIAENIIKRFEQ